MEYRLTIPTDFFGNKLNSKMLQGIVRDLRPLGIRLQFDIPGLEIVMTKESGSITHAEWLEKIEVLKVLFSKHCDINS